MITFGSIVTKVLQRLALVEGLDAQIYAEPRIQLAVQHKFDLIFREYWLPDYTVYQEPYTLDGVTGTIIGDLTGKLNDWRDLHSVMWQNSRSPLPIAPMNTRDTDIQYPSVRPFATDKTKMFKILPINSVGNVYITYRTKPADFEEDTDPIYMDTQLLLLGTCWDVLEDDGTNPGASDKFRVLFQDALSQFNRTQHTIPLAVAASSGSIWNRWA